LPQLRRGQRGEHAWAPYGLPTAISGHQNYYYWGWNGYTGESMLTLGDSREDYTDTYAEVIDLGPFDAPWIMDFEHLHYFWLRHRKRHTLPTGRNSSSGTELPPFERSPAQH
jgi:hypothetical protein